MNEKLEKIKEVESEINTKKKTLEKRREEIINSYKVAANEHIAKATKELEERRKQYNDKAYTEAQEEIEKIKEVYEKIKVEIVENYFLKSEKVKTKLISEVLEDGNR